MGWLIEPLLVLLKPLTDVLVENSMMSALLNGIGIQLVKVTTEVMK